MRNNGHSARCACPGVLSPCRQFSLFPCCPPWLCPLFAINVLLLPRHSLPIMVHWRTCATCVKLFLDPLLTQIVCWSSTLVLPFNLHQSFLCPPSIALLSLLFVQGQKGGAKIIILRCSPLVHESAARNSTLSCNSSASCPSHSHPFPLSNRASCNFIHPILLSKKNSFRYSLKRWTRPLLPLCESDPGVKENGQTNHSLLKVLLFVAKRKKKKEKKERVRKAASF